MSTEDDTTRRWKELVRASRVFFLGSGFSAQAGVPMTSPLFKEAMQLFAAECPGLFKRVDRYVKGCFGLGSEDPPYESLSLSEVCTYLHYIELREFGGGERWTNESSRENLAIRFYCAKAIAKLTPAPAQVPELYLRFARQLRPSDIVISFNWDCLLESALEAVGRAYTYTWDELKIKIWKMHGSINWCRGSSSPPGFDWEPLGFKDAYPGEEVFYCDELLDDGTWQDYRALAEVRPFIILPGFGKAFDIRILAPLWYKPEQFFSYTHNVYVVGLGLARDDFIIRSLFLGSLPFLVDLSGAGDRQVVVINPDPRTRENYGFLVGAPHVRFLCEPFEIGHVELMEETQPSTADAT